jgi:hypothetical protein
MFIEDIWFNPEIPYEMPADYVYEEGTKISDIPKEIFDYFVEHYMDSAGRSTIPFNTDTINMIVEKLKEGRE